MPEQENINQDFRDHILLLGYLYGVVCPLCQAKVLDMGKKRNQVHLKDTKCPSCSLNPEEERRRQKKLRKQQNKQKNKRGGR